MVRKISSQNKKLLGVLVVIFLLFVGVSVVFADIPMKLNQVSGYYRIQLGKFQITTIFDGGITVPKANLLNISEAELQELLGKAFIFGEIPSSVNTYLINTGSKLILVDTGAGYLLGAGLGYLPQNLKAAGYEPWQIDAILITHAHRDHFGGLLDEKDRLVFPRAKVYINRLEYEYWMSKDNQAQAPAKFLPYFALMQKTAPILQAKGLFRTFEGNEAPIRSIPEIRAIPEYGHTAGMTAFEVTSEDQKIYIWGDIVHAVSLQMPDPGVGISYDLYADRAAATRDMVFNTVAPQKTLVAGAHTPFPGMGHVLQTGADSFAWVPITYDLLPGQTHDTVDKPHCGEHFDFDDHFDDR
jgi:glyoxylase-like metal-dependent hydrolase (beta-lactamase superfamily II)